jgi:DNA-directed RNA polymerase sigma subunit (sigma70/sigma32)
MSTFVWPSEDGWPYPDTDDAGIPLVDDLDDDVLSLRAAPAQFFSGLDPLERQVIEARYGFDGQPGRSLKQLQSELGLPRADLRQALGSGLSKLRAHLA